jgi:hypothetical protein
MRTAIYVYSTTSFEVDHPIRSHPGAQTVLDGKTNISNVTLQPGIYKIQTPGRVAPQITPSSGSTFELMMVINDKDTFPDPPARAVETFTGLTSKSIQEFLPSALGDEKKAI